MLINDNDDNHDNIHLIHDKIDHSSLTIEHSKQTLNLFNLINNNNDNDNKSLINITINNNEQQIQIEFNEFHLSIDSNLRWTINHYNDHKDNEPLDSIQILGDTIYVNLNDNTDLSLNFTWTPQRHYIIIDIELRGSIIETSNITIIMQSLIRPERKNALMLGSVSMLELIDDIFPDDPFFSADNLTTILYNGKNLRQSLCYHWLMYNHINHSQSELQACHRIYDFCNLISHFVQQKQIFRMSNPCLSCKISQSTINNNNNIIKQVRFGSRQMLDDNDQAQIIYLLDGTCHRIDQPKLTLRFIQQLKRLSKVVERLFKAHKIRTEFSLVTLNRDGQYERIWSHPEAQFTFDYLVKYRFRNLKPIRLSNGVSIWNETMFRQSLWPINTKHSLDFLYQFAYSPRRTSRHLIMIDCGHLTINATTTTTTTTELKQSTCQENDIDFNTALNILLQSSNYFHVITGFGLSQRTTFTSTKMRHVIGIDWKQVMFDQQVAVLSKSNTNSSQIDVAQWLRQHITPNRDICHVLALETNGSVFNHRALKQANRQTLVQRLLANHQTKQCQRCDCTLAKDYIMAKQECFLCQFRPHTVLNRWQNGTIKDHSQSDNLFDGPQEWTDEDQQQFLEIEGHSHDNDNESIDDNLIN